MMVSSMNTQVGSNFGSNHAAANKKLRPLTPPTSKSLNTNNNDGDGGGGGNSSHLDPLTSKLNNMSIADRDDGLHDLHGISDKNTVEETPELLQTKIQEMSNELFSSVASLRAEESAAYRKALMMSPQYVEHLKVNFIRTSAYKPKEAASKLIRFFTCKKNLFGESKLVQDIAQNDLSKEAVEILEKGLFVIFPQRDRAGRAVSIVSGEVSRHCEFKIVSEALYYMIMSILQDKETQLRGIVIIWYGIGQQKFGNRTSQYYQIWNAMPTRLAGYHHCSEDQKIVSPLIPMVSSILESASLCRIRFHHGSYVECIYNVMTFGIPREAFPITEDGTWDLSAHHNMLQIVKQREENKRQNDVALSPSTSPVTSSSPKQKTHSDLDEGKGQKNKQNDNKNGDSSVILIPNPQDILLGRGRQGASRPGYLKMYNLIHEYMAQYESTQNKFEKTIISEIIVKKLNETGTRLLSDAPGGQGGYVECDHKVARAKIAHAFRNQRENRRKKEKAAAMEAATVTSNSDINPNDDVKKKRDWAYSFSN